MKIEDGFDIASGEVWSISGDYEACSRFIKRLGMREEIASEAVSMSFAQHENLVSGEGWPQARYYLESGSTVREILSYNAIYDINPFEIGAKRDVSKREFAKTFNFVSRLLHLSSLLDRPVIALSNGETRRVLFARALLHSPKLMLLDDPFGGLDPERREELRDILSALSKRGIAIILVCRHEDELPFNISHRLRIDEHGNLSLTTSREEKSVPGRRQATAKKALPSVSRDSKREPIVEFRDISLKIGKKVLFSHFNWTIRKGERWILRGENGSGKTTLFALITGDSPLAYALDIRVFSQKRAVGNKLSEIRGKIAMVSPESQAYLGHKPFDLLVEALAKVPRLLLLDEPFMNMSATEERKARQLISRYLRSDRDVAAIFITHREDEAPKEFNYERKLIK